MGGLKRGGGVCPSILAARKGVWSEGKNGRKETASSPLKTMTGQERPQWSMTAQHFPWPGPVSMEACSPDCGAAPVSVTTVVESLL